VSANNGVIRIGRKGIVKFAFGDGEPFEVDVVTAWQEWVNIDETMRVPEGEPDEFTIRNESMLTYRQAGLEFVTRLATSRDTPTPMAPITTAEAFDFIARLREQYEEVAAFFRPRLREERESPDSSATELRFSEEGSDAS